MHQAGNSGLIKNGEQRGRADIRGQILTRITVNQLQRELIGLADYLTPLEGVNGEVFMTIEHHGKTRGIGEKLHGGVPPGKVGGA